MLVGERLALRLSELELSQAELARQVGVSQQAIGKLINGQSRSTSYLHQIARALRTTPAYLMGETDDPDADAPPEPTLSRSETELLEYFRTMSAADQSALLTVARSMSGEPPAPRRLHSASLAYRGEDG